jgi:osmotically inducible lipoprotein OsmB
MFFKRNNLSSRYGLYVASLALSFSVAGCAPPQPGPDRQFEGMASGAVLGAGAGAVTGFQVSAGAGPGAAVGAGFGAVAGAISGAVQDSEEDRVAALARGTQKERERSTVHQILQDHYQKRIELHPTRDIYPADLFFVGDEVRLCRMGVALINEIAIINKQRTPSSRIAVAIYVKSKDPESDFARYLAEERARNFADQLERGGVNPRRIETRPMVVNAPVLIDPLDDPDRYSQSVELILLDK